MPSARREPFRVLGTVGQVGEGHDAERKRRNGFEDEDPLPAAQAQIPSMPRIAPETGDPISLPPEWLP